VKFKRKYSKFKIRRMTLIKSISGIRDNRRERDNLTPLDAVKFASAYGTWLKRSRSLNSSG
jgi:phosphomannomutase